MEFRSTVLEVRILEDLLFNSDRELIRTSVLFKEGRRKLQESGNICYCLTNVKFEDMHYPLPRPNLQLVGLDIQIRLDDADKRSLYGHQKCVR